MIYYYVGINRINGRRHLAELAESLNDRGYSDRVEYCEGGWIDNNMYQSVPHLRFDNTEDAIAYTLTYGGVIETSPPLKEPDGT